MMHRSRSFVDSIPIDSIRIAFVWLRSNDKSKGDRPQSASAADCARRMRPPFLDERRGLTWVVIGPPPAASKELLEKIQRVLRDAEFTRGAIESMLSVPELGMSVEDCMPLWLWRCRNRSPLSVLMLLFQMGQAVPAQQVRRAVAPCTLEEWIGAGLLRSTARGIVAAVELDAQPGFFIASDLRNFKRDTEESHVLAVTSSAKLVQHCLVTQNGAKGLDLGTGTGVLAFQLAAQCDQVAGLDLNERALDFARFNAALNGVDNVEFRASDRFSAVRGERFDLIAGNLPFVISPERKVMYRDAATGNTPFLQTILNEVSQHLEEGGYAQFTGQWTNINDLTPPPGCDAIVLRLSMETADGYAARWLNAGQLSAAKRECKYREWIEFYEREEIEHIHTGLITVQKRSGGKSWKLEMNRPLPKVSWGDRLESLFRDYGQWQALSAEEKQQRRLRFSPWTVIQDEISLQPELTTNSLLLASDGFSPAIDLDRTQRNWLAEIAGAHTLQEIMHALPAGEAGPFLRWAESLVAKGMVSLY